MSDRSKRDRWILILILGATAALGLVMLFVGWRLSAQPDDLWPEIAKAGMQLIVVGVIGGAVSAGWRWTEQRRNDDRSDLERRLEKEREVYERRLATFLQVVAAYNGVKAVRRTLKSLGFSSREGSIDMRQAAGFHEQMSRLNERQLQFEAIVRELEETMLFDSDTGAIRGELSRVENYLNRVLAVWEEGGAEVREGNPLSTAFDGLKDIIDSNHFDAGIVQRRREVTLLMHRHLTTSAGLALRKLPASVNGES